MESRPRFDPTMPFEQQPFPVWKQALWPWGYEVLLARDGSILSVRRVPSGTATDGTAGTWPKTYGE